MCNYHPKLIILMVEQTPRAMVALLIVASVYFWAFFKFIPLNYLLIWFSCLALLAAFRLYNANTLKKYIESKNEVKTRQHLMYFNISNVVQACMWTSASILSVMFAPTSFELVTFVMIIGIITAAALSMSPVFYSYLIFFFIMIIPQMFVMIYYGEHQHITLTIFALIYIPATVLLSKSIYDSHVIAIKTNDELESTIDELHKLSITDSLTNIYNRRYFFEMAQNVIKISLREHKQVSLLMIDIDHFKIINDTYGHKVGDDILVSFSSEVKRMIRKSDILARVGGEEFAILLHDTSLDGAKLIAEKLREIIEKKIFSFDDTSINISVSIGAAELSTSCSSIEELYKESDHRLYRAKKDGRNRVC